MPGGGSGMAAMEVSKIVLRLETNFKEVLTVQAGAFEKFTRDANTLVRQVGSNMNQLARTTSTTFSNIYKGNRKEVQDMVGYTRSAIQGVRKEAIKLNALQERMVQGQERRLAQIAAKQRQAQEIMARPITAERKLPMLKVVEDAINRAKKEYADYMKFVEKVTNTILVKNMAKATNQAMQQIAQGSRASAVMVNNAVNQMQKSFDRLWRRRGIMPQVDLVEQGQSILKQREAVIKQLDTLLRAHERKQVQAEQHLQKQKLLLAQQTNKAMAAEQKKMVAEAAAVVKKLGMEYEFMYNKINKLKSSQISQTALFRKQAEQNLQGIKQAVRGFNLKREFDAMWKQVSISARMAGEESGEAFFRAVAKGKALDAALVKKKEHLENLLQTARRLKASGLVPADTAIRRIQTLLSEIKKFRSEYLSVSKQIAQVPLVRQQRFSKGGLDQAKQSAFEIRKAVAALRSMGEVSEDNVVKVGQALGKIQQMYKSHASKVVQALKSIDAINKEMQRARVMAVSAGNQAAMKAWRDYFVKLRKEKDNIREELKRLQLPTKPFEEYADKTERLIRRVRGQAAKYIIPSGEISAHADRVKQKFVEIGQHIDQLARKKLVKEPDLKEGRQLVSQLEDKVKEYNRTIKDLTVQLERLGKLQRRGLGGAGMNQQMSAMRAQMVQLKQQVREYERLTVQMNKKMQQAQNRSLKGTVTQGWEMIRNFRWQVAAVIYLITRAVWFINRTIIRMLDNIGQYRKNAMSIAAAISFQMVENTKVAFDKAYAYSRKLMNQLEMVAAETILSLEDMLMLTKTFAQAGIVPKTEEDVRRIAVIGTAIKALTEGMANAGVQMRQELYAVIQGRQRATDQLAKMFQVMGINIKGLIAEGKKEGKDMITVLSDALKPFAEMNTRMKDEWEQVKNRLKVVWDLIQRIGGEDFLVSFAKGLNRLLDLFVEKGEKGFYSLSEHGAMLAAWVNVAFNTFKALYEVVVGLVDVIGSVLKAIGDIVVHLNDATAMMFGMEEQIKKNRSEWDGLIFLLQVFVQALNVVAIILQFVAAAVRTVGIRINSWLLAIRTIAGTLKAIATGDFAAIGTLFDEFTAGAKKADEDIKAIWCGEQGWLRKSWKSISDINDQFDKIYKTAQGINEEGGNLPDLFKLPESVAAIAERSAKLAPKLKEITLAGLEGPEKFAKQYEFDVAEPEEIKKMSQKNLAKLSDLIRRAINREFPVDADKVVSWVNQEEAMRKNIADMDKIIAASLKKRDKATADWFEKQKRKMAGWTREHETFWTKITEPNLTRAEKTTKWFKDMSAKLDELKVKNPLVAAEFEKFSKALEAALGRKRVEDTKAVNDEMEKLKLKLTSHRPVDSISKINNEFDKMKISIMTNKDFIERGLVPEMLKLWEITKRERIEVEKMAMSYQAAGAELEVSAKKAQYLMGEYSPSKRMQGELMMIQIEHQKTMQALQQEIDKTYKLWVENGQWATREGSAEAQRYVVALQEQMVELSKATEREIKKKQQPIWNDIVEASNNWADGFTDSLANIVDGIDSVSSALQQLQEQIIKDVLKTVIKRSITDQLQSALGSGSESPMAGFFGLFPGGKKEAPKAQEITATKPIPVTVYNPQDISNVFSPENMPVPGGELVGGGEIAGMGTPVYVTNLPGEGLAGVVGGGGAGETAVQSAAQATEQMANASEVIAEKTAEAEGSTRSWYSGITDIFSSIGGWFKNLFSGGGGATAGGGSTMGTVANLGMMAASAYGYADGGVISEPIVGKGLESGSTYNFGERAKYGENEMVAPIKKMQRTAPGSKVEYHMPIHVSAIDTQSGVEFLTKHSDTIQGQLTRNLRKNKPVRKGIQNAF